MKSSRLLFSLLVVGYALYAASAVAQSDSSCSMCSACCIPSTYPVDIWITKSGPSLANVTFTSDDKDKAVLGGVDNTVKAPITFGEGADWDKVKDSYTIDSAFAHLLEKGKIAISIATDGTASFKVLKK